MEFKCSCPHCQQQLLATEEHLGVELSCPNCSTAFIVKKEDKLNAATTSLKKNGDFEGKKTAKVTEWNAIARYAAKQLDLGLYSLILFFVVSIFVQIVWNKKSDFWLVYFLGLVLWCFIEALLLSTFGNTPFKSLFGVKVRSRSGEKPSFNASLSRAFGCYIKGLGLGIPVVCLFTTFYSYKYLKTKGDTSWNESNGISVSYEKIGIFKWIIILFVLSFWVYVYLIYSEAI